MARSAPFLVIAAAALLAGAVALIGLRKDPPSRPRAFEPIAPVASLPSLVTAPLVSVVPNGAPPPTPLPRPGATASEPTLGLDERSLMTKLRDLRGSDPSLTLQLAREGNQRFPDSPDVAERSWVIVKSLSDLGRHDEARVEGRTLVDRYRGTRWAEDVYRHLFVNPPTHPFERGYGKELETD